MFVVIEGVDCSGKQTQSNILTERLNLHRKAERISFPEYSSPSSALCRHYLNGDFGKDVGPKLASLFYAADRALHKSEWIDLAMSSTQFLVADRYYGSNAIHQGSKITDLEERKKFFNWVRNLEVCDLGLPEPTITFYLNMPLKVCDQLIMSRQKTKQNKSGSTKDIHEDDIEFRHRSHECGLQAASHYGWFVIDCVDKQGNLRTKEVIADMIWSRVWKCF